MRITLFGVGSRGDVQPLLALAVGLKAAGYEIRFATHDDFRSLTQTYGLEFFRLSGQAAGFFGGPAGIALRDRSRRDPNAYHRFFDDFLGAYSEHLLDESWDACQGADAVLSWPWTRIAPTVAQKLNIPNVLVAVTPVVYLPTREFPNPFQGEFDPHRGPDYNLDTWEAALPFFTAGQRQLERWRLKLGLPIPKLEEELVEFRQLPHLFGISPEVLPKPADWPGGVEFTGYWFLDHVDDYEPPPELARFLDSGDPPVVVGFGSQVGRSPQKLTELVVGALRRTGKRAIFVTGFGGLKAEALPENILKVPTCPYDWLLNRASAVVHQGGSGSTSAGVRAGKPSMAVPFGWDQPLWGHRLHELGVGAEPIPAEGLTVDRLADALEQLTEDETMRAEAQRLGDRIRREDGVGRAVERINQLLTGGPTGSTPDRRADDGAV